MSLVNHSIEQIKLRLAQIYDDATEQEIIDLGSTIQHIADDFVTQSQPDSRDAAWSEQDVVLITYADQVSQQGLPTLQTLNEFLCGHGISQSINTVHLLPFYPYSSDDGFSVIDYYDLAPGTGSWEDVANLNDSVDLMFDLVLNHCSQHSEWFQQFLNSHPKYKNYFHSFAEDQVDSEQLSKVTRPRSLPLLTEFETTEGKKLVWTTFSDDQVDLDFSNTDVLVEFIQILLFYIRSGARIIRLDAVAFLWKDIGTNCIHLEKTHLVIKLLREILDYAAPNVILLTETNVPHPENVSYFGDGDEAHMVYQFSLPPLILDTFVHEDPEPLRHWLSNLEDTPAQTTFFNFGASHDGIGVRPLEGILPPNRFQSLVNEVKERGGLVSTRRQPDGTDTPYELNISYYNAIVGNELDNDLDKVRKFIASQSIILALPGIPGIYFHSLVGTPNDHEGVQSSGIPRRINRHKYELDELEQALNQNATQSGILNQYLQLIHVRKQSKAFHPEGGYVVCDLETCIQMGGGELFVVERTAPDQSETVLTIVNPTSKPIRLALDPMKNYFDLVADKDAAETLEMQPFDFRWYRLLS